MHRQIEWLTDGKNPAISYLASREFLGLNETELEPLKERIYDWSPVKKLLKLQQEDGSFLAHSKRPGQHNTYIALHWMDKCGLDLGDAPVRKSFDFIQNNFAGHGAISNIKGASGILPCYVGMYIQPFINMGGLNEPCVQDSLQWICDYQRYDHKETTGGGDKAWPLRTPQNYGCWWSVSCYHGVVGTFRALAKVPPEARSPLIKKRLRQAYRYLEIHKAYKKTATDKPMFRHMLQFFLHGGYRFHLIDILEGLADYDPNLIRKNWVTEAMETVEGTTKNGRIVLVRNYPNDLIEPCPLERVGQGSRFLTYQWLSIKRKFGLPG